MCFFNMSFQILGFCKGELSPQYNPKPLGQTPTPKQRVTIPLELLTIKYVGQPYLGESYLHRQLCVVQQFSKIGLKQKIEKNLNGCVQGCPNSSAGKESICNARDPSLIPGSGRSAREGIGYPLQYSWASLVAQLVKNPPAMRETWV